MLSRQLSSKHNRLFLPDCSNLPVYRVSAMAQIHLFLKELDPHHLVSGALNCPNSFTYQDIPSLIPPPPEHSAALPWLSSKVQPQLQLSLDLVMVENYHR
eukprot:SAG22_NODE_4721_length_1182_cov_1.059095_2_plen_99_part_01